MPPAVEGVATVRRKASLCVEEGIAAGLG